MFNSFRERIINIFTNRLTILWVIMAALGAVLIWRCYKLQIIEGQTYLDNFVLNQEKTRDIPATRGNIYDRNGNLLAYNELAYSVKVEDTFDSSGSTKNNELNSVLYNLIRMIEANGDKMITDFKIVINEDNEFEFSVSGNSLKRFLADVYDHPLTTELTDEELASTAEDIIIYLSRPKGKGFFYGVGRYEIPDDKTSPWLPGEGYTKDEWLKIITIRYAMSQTSFRKYIGTTVATDISDKTVAVILENSDILPGVTIEEDTVRRYIDSSYFSHLLGYTGKISSDELEELNNRLLEEGNDSYTYSISDVVGKGGIENSMETRIQGIKGYEKVMVNNTGKVISVLERQEAVPGEDIYLTIDKDLTIQVYSIIEQKLAGLVASKIINSKEYIPGENSSSANIKIPIYDVYYQVIGNGIVNIKHFTSDNARETEKEVYQAYLDYREASYEKLRSELYDKRTIYKRLSNEFQVYESNIVQLLYKNNILMFDKIDQKDSMYNSWTVDENVSLGEYIDYCIAMNWVDTSLLDITEKYPSSAEIFDGVFDAIIDIIDNNTEFQKRFYKYMLLNDKISGRQICMLLYEQDACYIPIDEMERLKNGRISAYQFMMNRIVNIDITPAQLALDPCNASVVITNVHTGEVLAMVSYPGYNNNLMANSVDAAYFEKLTNDKSSPLLNFATQYKAAPGSTFKIVTATAGLMENVITLRDPIRCKGVFDTITPSPKCWNVWGHGNEITQTAIRDSCNYYFYEVGYRLSTKNGVYNDAEGLAALAEYADLYGLSSKSGLEISEYDPDVSDNDAVRSSIGQGTNSYTTAQLARYVSAIANRGTVYELTLIDHTMKAYGNTAWENEPKVRNIVDIPSDYWDVFHKGMRDVVLTKSYFNDVGVNVAGKTGTAQQSKSRPSHALFVSFAPYEEPEIGMAVRIPFGYSSDYAAQLARDIYKLYFELVTEEELLDGKADSPDSGITNEL